MYAIKSIPYVVQLHYKNSKNRKKKKQKFTTLDRLVMKIFRERGRTSRRGTRSFSSITTAALQNAQRVPAFSSSLFQLSLLLSFVSSLRTLFFLPVVSVSVHDSTSTLNVAIIPPLTILSTFPFPLHFATSLSTLSLSLPPPNFCLSHAASPHPTTPSALFFLFAIPYATFPSPSLCSWPFLFKRRDCSLHILRDQPRSVCSSLSIYPSTLYSSVRQLNPLHFSSHHQDFTLRALPLSLSFSMLCVVINL